MLLNKLKLQKDYSLSCSRYQLKLPLNLETVIPSDDSVRLLSQFVEEMDLTALYATFQRLRNHAATPRQMLKIVIYAAMNRLYSSRDIETACRRDINFMFLLEGMPVPDHATIARFKSLHCSLCSMELLAQMSEWLFLNGEISGYDLFIDGTKIESRANKYTFVWKKATTKNLAKLQAKIIALVEECEDLYGIRVVHDGKVSLHKMKTLRKKLYALKEEEGIIFVHGIGKRKSQLQKSIELLEEYTEKLKEYTKKLHVCGDRNSYSKTDPDATFMRMKEDAMLNGQLKPAYNLQHGVDSEYIVWLDISQKATDMPTLIPFLKKIEAGLGFKYTNIVADAGYESEENYLFIEENGQVAFIKPANYEISKTRKYQKDISRFENMYYDSVNNCYICRNNNQLTADGGRTRITASGFQRRTTFYACEDCSGCPYKKECIKGNHCKTPFEERNKRIEVSRVFVEKRKECLERITSEEGIQLRMNRSIQAEGSFSETKDGMGFRRYLSTGLRNVTMESVIIALAHNINKLHAKIQNDRIGKHLYEVKSA